MNDTNPCADVYPYTRLASASTQIRLLELPAAVDANADISGRLKVYERAACPAYAAISYTWGQPFDLKTISLDRHPILVRSNCRYALWQARLHGHYRVWIDSVCIDQTNAEEKSIQVASMLETYKNATYVLACVGPHDDASRAVFREFIPRINAMPPGPNFESVHPFDTNMKWVEGDDDRARVKMSSSIRAFGSRDYWERLWIVQELYAGNVVRVKCLCGNDATTFKHIQCLAWLARNSLPEVPEADDENRWDFSQMENLVSFIESLPVDIGSLKGRDISHLKCDDVRDRIFGILGVIAWPPDQPRIQPDYSKTPIEILRALLEYCASIQDLRDFAQCLGLVSWQDPEHHIDAADIVKEHSRSTENRRQRLLRVEDAWPVMRDHQGPYIRSRSRDVEGVCIWDNLRLPDHVEPGTILVFCEWEFYALALRKVAEGVYNVVDLVLPDEALEIWLWNSKGEFESDVVIRSNKHVLIELTDDETLFLACSPSTSVGFRWLQTNAHLEGRKVHLKL